MDNYMKINGKKIEISQETADNLQKEFGKGVKDICTADFKIKEGCCGGYTLYFKNKRVLEIYSEASGDEEESFKIASIMPDVAEGYKLVVEGNGVYIKKE